MRKLVFQLFTLLGTYFAVLPEETASAAIGTVSVVTHAVDHDRFFFH